MPGLEEKENTWRYRIQDPARYDRFRVKPITEGVQITYARVKGAKDHWEIQNYIFDKKRFKTRQQVMAWLERNLKKEIKSMLELKAWNEYRKRCLQAWMENSTLI